jgi:hypothetical protein
VIGKQKRQRCLHGPQALLIQTIEFWPSKGTKKGEKIDLHQCTDVEKPLT